MMPRIVFTILDAGRSTTSRLPTRSALKSLAKHAANGSFCILFFSPLYLFVKCLFIGKVYSFDHLTILLKAEAQRHLPKALPAKVQPILVDMPANAAAVPAAPQGPPATALFRLIEHDELIFLD